VYLTDSSVDMPRTVLGRGQREGGKQAEFELTETRAWTKHGRQPVLVQIVPSDGAQIHHTSPQTTTDAIWC
jgi:hypothetical protein